MDDIYLEHLEKVKLSNGNLLAYTNQGFREGSEHNLNIFGEQKRVQLIHEVHGSWGFYESSLGSFEETIWEVKVID